MKKMYLILLLSACCILNLSSCGNTNTTQPPSPTESKTEYVLEESREYILAKEIRDYLNQNFDTENGISPDYGKYNSKTRGEATNIPEYADTESQINKIIESEFGSEIGYWYISEIVNPTVNQIKSVKEMYGNELQKFWGSIYISTNRNTYIMSDAGGNITERNSSLEEYLKEQKIFMSDDIKKAIPATELYDAYQKNAASADREYLDKTFTIYGEVLSVESNNYDTKDKGEYCVNVGDGYFSKIQCYFKSSRTIEDLKQGDVVYIKGRGVGAFSVLVDMVDCQIIEK